MKEIIVFSSPYESYPQLQSKTDLRRRQTKGTEDCISCCEPLAALAWQPIKEPDGADTRVLFKAVPESTSFFSYFRLQWP